MTTMGIEVEQVGTEGDDDPMGIEVEQVGRRRVLCKTSRSHGGLEPFWSFEVAQVGPFKKRIFSHTAGFESLN